MSNYHLSHHRTRTPHHQQHPSPDIIGAAIYPMIAQEREAKQAATQFKKGISPNPGGKPKAEVNTVSYSPDPRDIKKMNEQSTVGQIAKLAGVSHHKARQAVAVVKAPEDIRENEIP